MGRRSGSRSICRRTAERRPVANEPVLRSLGRRPAGQGLVEYGIILGLAALVIVVLLVFFDDQVAAALDWLSSQLP